MLTLYKFGNMSYTLSQYKCESKTVVCSTNREKVVKGYKDHFKKIGKRAKKSCHRDRTSIRTMEDCTCTTSP